MYKVLTGAQMYSVRTLTQTQEGLDATLKALKEMGYTSVQLSGQNPTLDPSAVRDALDKYGLICPATHTSFTEYEENLDALIARHQKWGCAHPGVGAMPFHFAESEEGYREFARRANAVGKKLKDAGMNLIYHNHAFEFTRFGSTTGIEILMNEFTDVQMELDVYWVQSRRRRSHRMDSQGCRPHGRGALQGDGRPPAQRKESLHDQDGSRGRRQFRLEKDHAGLRRYGRAVCLYRTGQRRGDRSSAVHEEEH